MKKRPQPSMTALANAAFREAAQEVIKRAEESGTQVIIWNGESIQALDPREAQSKQTKSNGRRRSNGRIKGTL